MFATTTNFEIYYRIGTKDNKKGTSWKQYKGSLKHISVGYGPILWGIDTQNLVWFKELGVPTFKTVIIKKIWKVTLKKLVNLDVGYKDRCWGISTHGNLLMRSGITAKNIYGRKWVNIKYRGKLSTDKEKLTRVAFCTNGHLWAASTKNKLYFRNKMLYAAPTGDGTWTRDKDLPANAKIVSVACGLKG